METKKSLKKYTKIKTKLFAIILGIDSWSKQITNLKNELCFSNMNSLEKAIPNLNHHENFISRIPLYKRWYGESDQMIKLFY